MPGQKYLWQVAEEEIGKRNIARIEIPSYITGNIKHPLFDWQKAALQRFLAYEDPANNLIVDPHSPTHLLFNMATGTGKTLMIAALILYYYKKGYRNFIFFVNQNNIVGKTEENLLNKDHRKYLFKSPIVVDDRNVSLRKVKVFSDQPQDIEIVFTSIQKLHNAVYTIREDQVYLQDLLKQPLVMIGDEAHHFNTDTRKQKVAQTELEVPDIELKEGASEADLEKSWENTVIKELLNKGGIYPNSLNKNVLLEFTATIPREDSVKAKYFPKTIYSFDLKEFLKAGYTKEINLISSSFNKKNRVLQALLFNWYRNKIAIKYGITHFKPVILFRSKRIADSERDFQEFRELIQTLTVKDFLFLKNYTGTASNEIYEKGKSRILDIIHFIEQNKIDWKEIINYIGFAFRDENCLITNSKAGAKKTEKTNFQQDKLLNSLEDKTNTVTAIFTVNRLTEGWDVLNLFDIVRLYEGQNEGGSSTKTSEATISEVQLIGRGVRYYPFQFGDMPQLKRKFDNDLKHELRVLEEFYFHSDDEHRYISQLKNELKNRGYIESGKKFKTFSLKKEFTAKKFYRNAFLLQNEKLKNPNAKKQTLKDIAPELEFTVNIEHLEAEEVRMELDKEEDTLRYSQKKDITGTLVCTIDSFEKNIIRKAINIVAKAEGSLLRFDNLKEELAIESTDDLTKETFIGKCRINIIVPRSMSSLSNVSNHDQLNILVRFFKGLQERLNKYSMPFIGSAFEEKKFENVFGTPKEKLIEEDPESVMIERELIGEKWYVVDAFNGTSEERSLITFVKESLINLEEKYDEVYLLRNEEVYSIYSFKEGRKFQPDFLLFLRKKNKEHYCQVFIEPKGDQFKDSSGEFILGKEGWKEEFLAEVSSKYGHSNPIRLEGKDYSLIGLPLYNEKKKDEFRSEYFTALDLDA
jgi:type III restriction enzyme